MRCIAGNSMMKRDRHWLLEIVFLIVLVIAGQSVDFSLELLLRRGVRFFDIASAMVPPDASYAAVVVRPLWATIQMSLIGTVAGAAMGMAGALFADSYVNACGWLRIPFKGVVNLIRTIPALILALICTFLVGLGALAGTIAITLYTFVVMTRMGYEDMENTPLATATALEVTGCGRFRAFARTVLPTMLPSYLTNVLYLLEANVRHAAILGYVGAGGIGILLNERIAWREYSQVGMILLMLYGVVILAEGSSEVLRRVLDGTYRLRRSQAVLLFIIIAALVISSVGTLEWPDRGGSGFAAAASIADGLIHPDWSMILSTAHDGVPYLLYETFCIALLGTVGGTAIAAWFSFTASFRLLPWPLALVSRLFLMLVRTIPVFVYGLMCIRVTGPGPFAGVLTLTLCSVGLLAKRFLLAIDDIDLAPFQAYRAMGTPYIACLRYALWPQLYSRFAAAILYRMDVNLRDAAILGLVGAGGIGTPLILAMMHYSWAEAGALLWGLVVMVAGLEMISEGIRKSRRRDEYRD
jgi:phosphonate transport system permease protein